MNQPMRSKDFFRWVRETWTKAQDEAWEKTKDKLEKPETLEVFKRIKDR